MLARFMIRSLCRFLYLRYILFGSGLFCRVSGRAGLEVGNLQLVLLLHVHVYSPIYAVVKRCPYPTAGNCTSIRVVMAVAIVAMWHMGRVVAAVMVAVV